MTERERWLIIEGFIAGYAAAANDGDRKYDRRTSDKALDWLNDCVADGVTVEMVLDREADTVARGE